MMLGFAMDDSMMLLENFDNIGSLGIWNITGSQGQIRNLHHEGLSRKNRTWYTTVISDCGHHAAIEYDDGNIAVWDLETSRVLAQIQCAEYTHELIAFIADNHSLVIIERAYRNDDENEDEDEGLRYQYQYTIIEDVTKQSPSQSYTKGLLPPEVGGDSSFIAHKH